MQPDWRVCGPASYMPHASYIRIYKVEDVLHWTTSTWRLLAIWKKFWNLLLYMQLTHIHTKCPFCCSVPLLLRRGGIQLHCEYLLRVYPFVSRAFIQEGYRYDASATCAINVTCLLAFEWESKYDRCMTAPVRHFQNSNAPRIWI